MFYANDNETNGYRAQYVQKMNEAADYYREAVALRAQGQPTWLWKVRITHAKTALSWAKNIREDIKLQLLCKEYERSLN